MIKVVNFYDNGVIMETGNKNDTGKQGKWIYYNDNGILFMEIEYKNDKYDGRFIRYHENGIIAYTTLYVNGIMDGRGYEYYENGKLKEEWEYIKGNYFPINYWDEADKQILKDGTGKMPFYYGTYDHKIVEKYFEKGKVVKEVIIKDTGFIFEEFIPDKTKNR